MKSLLDKYREVLKEFEITEEDQVPPVGRVAYLQEQLGQQRAILNRLVFDLTTSLLHLEEAKDPLSKNAHRAQGDKYRNDVSQTRDSIRINKQLIEDLRKEYPELQVEQ